MNWQLYNDPQSVFRLVQLSPQVNILALVDYYSKKGFPDVPPVEELNRKMVWNFKDGRYSAEVAVVVARSFKNYLRSVGSNPETLCPQFSFCIIPASTLAKTTTRFQAFCTTTSEQLGCTNGFDWISVAQDHEQTKGDRNKNIVQYLRFNEAAIKDANILLFDDVKTTGKSFLQCARELQRLGAKGVIGLFLAETYSTYRNGNPPWSTVSSPESINPENVDDLPF
jgi:ATP-dependent DNA helicase RecQ